jgi:hypothetical protein
MAGCLKCSSKSDRKRKKGAKSCYCPTLNRIGDTKPNPSRKVCPHCGKTKGKTKNKCNFSIFC